MNKQTGKKAVLKDRKSSYSLRCSDTGKELKITVLLSDGVIEIRPEGFGVYGSKPGEAGPVYAEFFCDQFQLVYFTDINREQGEVIAFEKAREIYRQIDTTSGTQD